MNISYYAKFESYYAKFESYYAKFESCGKGRCIVTIVASTLFEQAETICTLKLDKPRRHAVLDFLSLLEPGEVYGITEQNASTGGDHLTVIYYREKVGEPARLENRRERPDVCWPGC